MALYCVFVRLLLEYASIVCSISTKEDINALQKVRIITT